jgi:molybdenum cofactor cytidylyltransferase
MISGVILAAGGSSRMGRPKQLLPLAGRPLLQHVVDRASMSEVGEVLLVLGAQAQRIRAGLEMRDRVRILEHGNWREGQSSSLRAALAVADPSSRGALILLGDEPLVPFEAIQLVLDAFRTGDWVAVRASYAGEPGHPVLLGRELWPRLQALEGDRGAGPLLKALGPALGRVEVGQPRPVDVDTSEDYHRLGAEEEGPSSSRGGSGRDPAPG